MLSDADDTVLLKNLLEQISIESDNFIHCKNAGTVFRFLTAFLAIKPGKWVLDGDERMRERPIKPLVEALNSLGADIRYTNKDGFPPLEINGKSLHKDYVRIDPIESSQYISALMMIAPSMENGLHIELKYAASSFPYIVMTGELMRETGLSVDIGFSDIHITSKEYKACKIKAEKIGRQLLHGMK